MQYWQLEHHGKTHENAFCALLAEHPGTLAVCLRSHEEMIRRTHNRPHTVTCPFGLTESAVPVRLGEQTIGRHWGFLTRFLAFKRSGQSPGLEWSAPASNR